MSNNKDNQLKLEHIEVQLTQILIEIKNMQSRVQTQLVQIQNILNQQINDKSEDNSYGYFI
jgi:hypothetical protein